MVQGNLRLIHHILQLGLLVCCTSIIVQSLETASWMLSGKQSDDTCFWLGTETPPLRRCADTFGQPIAGNSVDSYRHEPLTSLDIGAVGVEGSMSLNSQTGEYTVAGSGDDIFSRHDNFHYAFIPWSGDGEIIARVSSIAKTHPSSKAGVMFRESLHPKSANAVMEVKATTGAEFQYRDRTGGNTSFNSTEGIAAPHYVRLTRIGDTFVGYRSYDGKRWELQGRTKIPMTEHIYVGLAVTSHSSLKLNTSTFDRLRVSPKIEPMDNTPGSTGVTGFVPLLTEKTFDPLSDDGQTLASQYHDTDEFYTYRNFQGIDKGYDEDEGKDVADDDVVFRLTPTGELHILGIPNKGQREPFGYISTEDSYRNYHLSLEYRWGDEKFAPRDRSVRDSGLLYHVPKPEDVIWTDSIETQIQEYDTGDFWFLWGRDQARATVAVAPGKEVYQPAGELQVDHGGRIKKSKTVDSLSNWNRVEVIVEHDAVTVVVNGKVVNRATDMKIDRQGTLVPLTEGKIQLQAEGAEVYYRNIQLKPTHAVGGRGSFKVLVFQESDGKDEQLQSRLQAAQAAIVKLGQSHGFEVDIATNSLGVFSKEKLSQYAAIVWNNTSGDALDKAERAAFKVYIQAGGGYVGLNAAASETDWSWYQGLVGATIQNTLPQQLATLRLDREGMVGSGGSGLYHPAADSLPQEWHRHDTWYKYRANPHSKVNVLLTRGESSLQGQEDTSMPAKHPIAWWQKYDAGRSFYTGVGQRPETFNEPLYLMHLLGGIEYAAGRSRVPPSDAVVLYNGTSMDAFQRENGAEIGWQIDEDGNLEVVPGNGYFVETKEGFTDYHLHLEFKIPATAPDTSEQKRGNSGLYLHRSYELQMLDSYRVDDFDENHLGSIYGVKAADANASLPAETWQVYDVQFTAPRFDDSGQKTANARVTAHLNGVLIHDDVELKGPTAFGKKEQPGSQPFILQDHDSNSRLLFRNIWLLPTPAS